MAATGAGSVLCHFAVVKPPHDTGGGTTRYIDHGTHGDAEAELRNIAADFAENFTQVDTVLIRRTGSLGEIISLVAATSQQRGRLRGLKARHAPLAPHEEHRKERSLRLVPG